jgi:hypothetical protein
LVHCYGGSDRTGLATALYLAAIKHAEESDAESQLSLLYGHLPFGSATAMDHTFDHVEPLLGYVYHKETEEKPIWNLSLNLD